MCGESTGIKEAPDKKNQKEMFGIEKEIVKVSPDKVMLKFTHYEENAFKTLAPVVQTLLQMSVANKQLMNEKKEIENGRKK
jgi:hypothetical protein